MVRSIAVVANCQVASYARCFKALAKDVEVVPIPLARARTPADCEALAARAVECDVVFSQPQDAANLGPLNARALLEASRRFQIIPTVLFWGFHPDATHVGQGRTLAWAPIGPFHSRLAIGAFLHGCTADRAVALFNALTFERLDYFGAYHRALAVLQQRLAEIGFDVSGHAEGWLNSGPFMHAPNHPNMAMIGDLTRMAAEKARMEVDLSAPLESLPDPLSRAANYPVYPELARRLGVETDGMHRPGEKDGGEPMTREEFVRRSFDLYATADRQALEATQNRRTRDFFAALG